MFHGPYLGNWEGYQESLRFATTFFPDIGTTKDSVDAAKQALTDAILEADEEKHSPALTTEEIIKNQK